VLLDKVSLKQVDIPWSEIKVSYYIDSGNGGQKRNRTLSGVRLQYKDYLVTCCEGKSQHNNKKTAYKRLTALVQKKSDDFSAEERTSKGKKQNKNKGKRGGFARNYNYQRNEIRQGDKKFCLSQFLKGNLKPLYKKGRE